jgi:hypothetical protein
MATTLQRNGSASSAPESEVGPLLAAVIEAKRITGLLAGPEHLRDTVAALVERAHAMRPSAIYGASEIGQSLAGAMAYASPRLRLWQPGDTTAVLLIDGVVAGLSGVHLAGEHAKAVGAMDVDALIVGIVPGDREVQPDPRIGQIVTLPQLHRAAA